MSTIAAAVRLPRQNPRAFLVLAALSWLALYYALIPASEALVAALPVDRETVLAFMMSVIALSAPELIILRKV